MSTRLEKKTAHAAARRTARNQQAGFTLVELMVVVSIIAILATIVGINVIGQIGQGNVTAAKAQIKNFKTAIIGYKLQHRRLPGSLDDLVDDSKGEPLLDSREVPKDPWGNDYVYKVEGSKFTIVSYGADGAPGGTEFEDKDISSDNLQNDD